MGRPRKKCNRTNCTCNCCDKRANKHCEVHENGCHVKCG